MAEWSIASDCKSDAFGLRGFKSLPTHKAPKGFTDPIISRNYYSGPIKNFMSQTRLVKVANKKTGEVYHTSKNKKKVERKLKLKKYSAKLRKHVEFNEIKK